MFERFRDSLINPERIIFFRKDSIFRILFVMLFYATLMSLFMIIDTTSFKGLNIPTKAEIRDTLYEENVDCQILNYNLECSQDESVKLFNYFDLVDFYIVSADTLNLNEVSDKDAFIVLHDNLVHVSVYGVSYSVPLNSIQDWNGLDFNDLELNPENVSEPFITGIENYLLVKKGTIATMMITSTILLNFFIVSVLSVLTGVFIRARYKVIPFKETFRFGVYVSSSTFLVLTLMNMLGSSFIFILFIIIFNSRQMGRLNMAINKVMKK